MRAQTRQKQSDQCVGKTTRQLHERRAFLQRSHHIFTKFICTACGLHECKQTHVWEGSANVTVSWAGYAPVGQGESVLLPTNLSANDNPPPPAQTAHPPPKSAASNF